MIGIQLETLDLRSHLPVLDREQCKEAFKCISKPRIPKDYIEKRRENGKSFTVC